MWCLLPVAVKEAVMQILLLHECKDLFKEGYREVTLLGQNVDSYQWIDDTAEYTERDSYICQFVEKVAQISSFASRTIFYFASKRYYG